MKIKGAFSWSTTFSAALLALALHGTNATAATGNSLSGQSFTVVSGAPNSASGTSISGSGAIVFSDKLTAFGDKIDRVFQFSLPSPNSAVTLVVFSKDDLSSGYNLTLSRQADNTLKATLAADGHSADISAFFVRGVQYPSVESGTDLTVSLRMDFHNDEHPLHNLMWVGSTASPTEANAFYNSEIAAVAAPGNGHGFNRGVILVNATLLSDRVGSAVFQD